MKGCTNMRRSVDNIGKCEEQPIGKVGSNYKHEMQTFVEMWAAK